MRAVRYGDVPVRQPDGVGDRAEEIRAGTLAFASSDLHDGGLLKGPFVAGDRRGILRDQDAGAVAHDRCLRRVV